ncbi:hypothetical protein GTCCBUS3UF5_8560 [Geobacillus thermoleovorans CCB_US3_UF5]|uniref:Transposase n=1 Tax=Geobacillus thermoleovorans CCB_US3_UF5 TaxID=1111068 RepID=A0ABM5MF03_GEOTH|nr:hypothetical protein GTCCBUS3UF5_8560 [Geobacillus thermoleovorans CCB_US3_UF5]
MPQVIENAHKRRELTQKSAKKRTFGVSSFFMKSYIDHERFRLNPMFHLNKGSSIFVKTMPLPGLT